MKIFKITAILLLSVILTNVFSQNNQTYKDEFGNIRFFKSANISMPLSNLKNFNGQDILKKGLEASSETSFLLVKTTKQQNGNAKLVYQQIHNGIPVYDGYYSIHFKKDNLEYCSGKFIRNLNVSNTVNITSEIAQKIGEKIILDTSGMTTDIISKASKLVLFKIPSEDTYYNAFEITINLKDASKSKEMMIDAFTGKVLATANTVCNINSPGTAQTNYSGTRAITGDSFNGLFRLREDNAGVAVSTLNNQNLVETTGAVDFFDNDNNWTVGEHGFDRVATDVHWGTEQFLNYFRTTFNRNGFDNNNLPVTSYVHRNQRISPTQVFPMDNAFWDPVSLSFSYGDGFFIFNSVTSLDVVAHENGHGLAHFEVGFNRFGEAGSLNEGFSDIWGAVVENAAAPNSINKNPWQIGEEIMANGFSCLRSLEAPPFEGFRNGFTGEGNYPSSRLDQFWSLDNNPPHVNATVLGHWFFLLSQGGTGTNTLGTAFSVNGLGIQTAAEIPYNAELQINSAADFMAVRIESIQYAITQWGACSNQVAQVINAWFAVGVGDNNLPNPPITSVILSSYYHIAHTNGKVRFTVNWQPSNAQPTEIRWYNAATNQLITTTPGYINNFEWTPNCPLKPKTNSTDCISVYAQVVACNTAQSNTVGGIFNCYYKTWSTQWGGCPLYQRNEPIENEPAVLEGLKIYPNPATTSFTISHNAIINKIRIIDKTGRINKLQFFSNQLKAQTISTMGLKPDVYTIIISDGEKEYTTKLIVL
jgi:bacillolysin